MIIKTLRERLNKEYKTIAINRLLYKRYISPNTVYTLNLYLRGIKIAAKMQIKFAGVAVAAGPSTRRLFAAVIVCPPPLGFGWRTPFVIGFH